MKIKNTEYSHSIQSAKHSQGLPTPTKKKLVNALRTYQFHNALKWSGVPMPGAKLGKEVVIDKKAPHPDGFAYKAYVLKNDPSKVVFARTGGFAGRTEFSQPVDWTRLPKGGLPGTTTPPTPAIEPRPDTFEPRARAKS